MNYYTQKQNKWVFSAYDDEKVSAVSKKYGVSELFAKVVLNRFDDADSFFETDTVFHSPHLLHDMDKAVARIKSAVGNNEKIIVFGDYDVDGITSAYILTDYLKSIGADADYYIPDRADEGYGLSVSAIKQHKKNGVSLIVTVDLGITAFDEAQFCKNEGIDLIITDHHTLYNNEFPTCTAVVNPKIESDYPFPNLAGVGVAFKLICAMCEGDKKIMEKYFPFAAIGTIADLVELKDENRYIAKEGIRLLKNTDNIGLKALFKEAGADILSVNASTIGFSIGPRLNAAGRLSSADISVKLLMEKDEKKAAETAGALNAENERRKDEEQQILNEALEIINEKKLYENDVIVVSKDGWHHGVIGIVSSRITDMFYKPSIVISTDESCSLSKASGRSIKGFNLFDALSHCADYLEKFGGHSLAAGLSIDRDKIELFDKCINEYAHKIITDEIATPKIFIDASINLESVSLETVDEFKALEPFGMGNKSPCFCINSLEIRQIRTSKNHAFLTVGNSEFSLAMPAFNMKDKILRYCEGDFVDVCGSLSINSYQGKSYPQFVIKDIRPSDCGFLTRSTVLNIYMIIKNLFGSKKIRFSPEGLILEIQNRYKVKIGMEKLVISLKILKELELIDYKNVDGIFEISEKQNFLKKTNIEKSKTYLMYSGKRRKGNG